MNSKKPLLNITLSLAMMIGICTISIHTIAAEEYVPTAKKTVLHQAPLPNVEGKEMTVVHFTFLPEYIGSKHIHPGPVFVYVLAGELTVELEGETKTFKAGELYAEAINASMIGRNMSKSDELEILVSR